MRTPEELDKKVTDLDLRTRRLEELRDIDRRNLDHDKNDRANMFEQIKKLVGEVTHGLGPRLEALETNQKAQAQAQIKNDEMTAEILGEVKESGAERERRIGADEERKKSALARKETIETVLKVLGGVLTALTIGGIILRACWKG